VESMTCKVSVTDVEGVEHSCEVTAGSLYEAVARGLHTIKGNAWAELIAWGDNTVRVVVTATPVTHVVRLRDFGGWLGGTPRGDWHVARREFIRKVLNGEA
jgi:hypothetical protein